jgi:phosphomevalonate kinase
MAQITLPGNLLLLGEYAVLEEGGLGIAVAIEHRISISVRAAESLAMTGTTGKERFRWTDGSEHTLLGCLVEACRREIGRDDWSPGALPLRLDIDSSPFYDRDRGKSGFGSSAAVAVGVAYALLRASGVGGRQLLPAVYRVALGAHREFQGGRGSGYDIAASLYGGISLFSGGRVPSASPVELSWLPSLALFAGAAPVRTADSVGKYARWKRQHKESAAHFLSESNRCVSGFAASKSWEEASTWFTACRDLSVWLGVQIGVPAEIAPPGMIDSSATKAVGAGNELGVALLARSGNPLASGAVRYVEVAATGLNWVEFDGERLGS